MSEAKCIFIAIVLGALGAAPAADAHALSDNASPREPPPTLPDKSDPDVPPPGALPALTSPDLSPWLMLSQAAVITIATPVLYVIGFAGTLVAVNVVVGGGSGGFLWPA